MRSNVVETLDLKMDFAAKFGNLSEIVDTLDRRAKAVRGVDAWVKSTAFDNAEGPQFEITVHRPRDAWNLQFWIHHRRNRTKVVTIVDVPWDPIDPFYPNTRDSLIYNLSALVDRYLAA